MSPPIPCSIMIRAASRETRKLPFAMTSCCRSQSCSVVSSSGLEIDRPALLTTRSTPPKASAAARNAAATASASRHVGGDADRHVGRADLGGGVGRLLQVEVGDDDAGALGGEPDGDRLADAAGRAGDQRDAGRQRLGLRHPRELGLLQRPVLDAELLALVDRRVGGHRLGAAHDVDGVDVELAGHPRGLLVGAEAEHADARAPARSPGRRRASAGCRGSRAGSSRRRTRRGTPRAAPSAARRRPRPARSTAGRRPAAAPWCAGSGRGSDVPSAASRGCSVEARKSRTTSASVKCPTCGLSVRGQAADHRRQQRPPCAGARPGGSAS